MGSDHDFSKYKHILLERSKNKLNTLGFYSCVFIDIYTYKYLHIYIHTHANIEKCRLVEYH